MQNDLILTQLRLQRLYFQPTLIEFDLLITNYVCKDLISK